MKNDSIFQEEYNEQKKKKDCRKQRHFQRMNRAFIQFLCP